MSRLLKQAAAAAALTVAALFFAAGPAAAQAGGIQDQAGGRTRAESLVADWGIEPISIRLAASGYMLDFRYRIVNAEKAKALMDHMAKPVLVDEVSGARFMVPVMPFTGAIRASAEPVAGKTYYMFFANPGRYVKPGNRVSIEVADRKVQGLVVQ